ncbi:MAG TPA: sigma-70 family RNA polymerase sigma factor [Gemmatimonadaceae bacterium]|nr:sigma-70 family RNA polymerase sigma factor [Gemmatimonadaceae bacterium]
MEPEAQPRALAPGPAETLLLVAGARRGDESATRRLYDTHVDTVFRLAHRMTNDIALAEDLTQEVFIRAFNKLELFRGEAAFGTWLYGLAVRVILNGLRAARRVSKREWQAALESEQLQESLFGQEQAHLRSRLRAAFNKLPSDLRVAVLLYDVEGKSHEEVAAILGIGTGAARMRLSRGRAQLRNLLKDVFEEWKNG